jgi:hypothetical protein
MLLELGSLGPGFVTVAKLCSPLNKKMYRLIKHLIHCTLKLVNLGIITTITFALEKPNFLAHSNNYSVQPLHVSNVITF